ncbi:MAG TPA: triphosphoribosyl-dephospho-CoA synthase MdcB [Herbaspirillum sp.]|nr:triphosphoribosyl-dephospho-CoA synthase MdcB [Herbaspirillum sp.]
MKSRTLEQPFVPTRFCAEVGRLAVRSLYQELVLYPKPGLVSLIDNGSHQDMDASTFMRSLFSLRGYFVAVTAAGMRRASFDELRTLGIAAEARMMRATGGVNTHRGAIFCLGMLCAAVGAGYAQRDVFSPAAIRANVLAHWGEALGRHSLMQAATSHGGAREEAALGFPAIFEIALPQLEKSQRAGIAWHETKIDTLFLLMSHIHDSNVYRRGGLSGAEIVKDFGRQFLAAGGTSRADWMRHAIAVHDDFVRLGLSPGGAADLLAASCFAYQVCSVRNASPTPPL